MFESASWLVTRGETERAVAVLKKIATINGRDVPENVYQSFKVSFDPKFTTDTWSYQDNCIYIHIGTGLEAAIL